MRLHSNGSTVAYGKGHNEFSLADDTGKFPPYCEGNTERTASF